MKYQVHQSEGFSYIEEGKGEPLLLIHGLFGALSNWDGVLDCFKSKYRVIIPSLPINEMPIREAGCEGLTAFIENFISFKKLKDITILGNSLGGHIALLYSLKHANNVRRLILTGSSGLFENTMGGSFPKRGNFEYIKERVQYTFYDPKIATDELIKEVFETTNSIPKAMRIVAIAKSAQRNNLSKELLSLTLPTLLIWGLNDTITPPQVGYEFNSLIKNSELHFIDKCCHAPMMETPEIFNNIMEKWLKKTENIYQLA